MEGMRKGGEEWGREGKERQRQRRDRQGNGEIFKMFKLGNLDKKLRGVICTILESFL